MSWVARNGGLSGSALNVNFIFIHPSTKFLPRLNHRLFIATNGGVFHSRDGGVNWGQYSLPDPSNAEFADDPAATVDELTFHWVSFDNINAATIFVLAAKTSALRIWIYKSVNSGQTWNSRGVLTV